MVGNWMGTCLKTGAWSNSNVTCVPKGMPIFTFFIQLFCIVVVLTSDLILSACLL